MESLQDVFGLAFESIRDFRAPGDYITDPPPGSCKYCGVLLKRLGAGRCQAFGTSKYLAREREGERERSSDMNRLTQ